MQLRNVEKWSPAASIESSYGDQVEALAMVMRRPDGSHYLIGSRTVYHAQVESRIEKGFDMHVHNREQVYTTPFQQTITLEAAMRDLTIMSVEHIPGYRISQSGLYLPNGIQYRALPERTDAEPA